MGKVAIVFLKYPIYIYILTKYIMYYGIVFDVLHIAASFENFWKKKFIFSRFSININVRVNLISDNQGTLKNQFYV